MHGGTWYLDGSFKLHAPAKLNLFLHVTGQRRDGYHTLESLFAFTQVGDTVTIAPSNKPGLTITGPFARELNAVTCEDNLVCKAAQAVALKAGRDVDVHITLEKNLPIASGIGGGSADAAAVILGLNSFWQLNWDMLTMEVIALTLGADVPACLYKSPLYVTGVGEVIQVVELPKSYGVVLVNPSVGVSTPAVFSAYKNTSSAGFDTELNAYIPRDDTAFIDFLLTKTQNSLQEAAQSICPAVSSILDVLKKQPKTLFSQMSGSGATCFSLFDTQADAEKVADVLKVQYPDWWVAADTLQAR